MNICPCCSNTLLKHWEQKKTYWYCVTCRQEMPNLQLINLVSCYQQQSNSLMNQFAKNKRISASPTKVVIN